MILLNIIQEFRTGIAAAAARACWTKNEQEGGPHTRTPPLLHCGVTYQGKPVWLCIRSKFTLTLRHFRFGNLVPQKRIRTPERKRLIRGLGHAIYQKSVGLGTSAPP